MTAATNAPWTLRRAIMPPHAHTLWLVAVLLVAAWTHFFRLGQAEFVGEDEALVMVKVARQFLWREDLRNLGALLTSAHPPLRLLVATPSAALFGPTEFGLRLPNAAAGVLVCLWTYGVGRRLFGSSAGLLAAACVAVSGMSGVYRSANGIGLFTWLLLGAFAALLDSLSAAGPAQERRALTAGAVWLGLATWTFVEGGIFALSAAALYGGQRRRWKPLLRPALIYAGFLGIYALFWVLLPALLLDRTGVAGNTAHILARLQGLGAWNGVAFVGRLLTQASPGLALLLVAGLGLHLRRWTLGSTMVAVYVLPHWLVWMLLLEQPQGHEIYLLPWWAMLAAAGIVSIAGPDAPHWRRVAVAVTTAAVLALALWQTSVIYLQARIPATRANGVWFDERWLAAGAPRFVQWGQPAAGVYIRTHAAPQETIVTDFGGSLELYYAGRPSHGYTPESTAPSPENLAALRAHGIRFLVRRVGGTWSQPQGERAPACLITVGGRPSLAIYDLNAPQAAPEIWAAEQVRPQFYTDYATFTALRPFLLEPAAAQ
ncbi:MAG: glycosyltransferase family 39 protein [Caldilineaceae bacterium]|nr:glycosyltransferase family 39 protein [Caldilineaceae bacterium]